MGRGWGEGGGGGGAREKIELRNLRGKAGKPNLLLLCVQGRSLGKPFFFRCIK